MFDTDILVTIENEAEGRFLRITNTIDDTYVNIPIDSVSGVADLMWDVVRNDAS